MCKITTIKFHRVWMKAHVSYLQYLRT